MPIREIRHPLIRHKLGLMRRADISTKNFRELAQEVGSILTYEATSDLPLEHYSIDGWCGPVQVEKISGKKITVVPILRAGIGMLRWRAQPHPRRQGQRGRHRPQRRDAAGADLFGKAGSEIEQRLAIIIDPMLATGGSMVATIDMLKRRAARRYAPGPVAAPEGIAAVEEAHPDVLIFTASIDQRTDEHGYIVPGLGDAGDKIFGTKQKDI